MFEYVRWCSSLEDFALGKSSKVQLRTRRYSKKRSLSSPFFFAVSGKQLSRIVFLNALSPIYIKYLKHIKVKVKVKEVEHNISHD